MNQSQQAELRAVLREAFTHAINSIGLDAFKRTSFFGSNDPAAKAALEQKQAA